VAVLGFSLTGCVTQERYQALKLDRDRQAEQLAQAQTDASTAKAEADAYKRQLQALMDGTASKDALNGNYLQQMANLQAQLDEANKKYAEALALAGKAGTALPVALTNELSAFASANPDLVEFDSARGIVKFRSDLTFATGDATLTPKAKDVITRFASILNSPAAINYELLVAGHTDNTPVANPATIAKGHKDNWYLSSHRAIAVGKDLIASGVGPQRLGMVGYADQHPVASYDSAAGKAQNRRVEVLILPTTVRPGATSPVADAAPAPAPRRSHKMTELNKDSASVEASMNK
jgi:chemotaxis protein MotB